MDFTLLQKIENCGICYKFMKATFYYGYYAIIAQTKKEFYCSSFASNREDAQALFCEIAESATEPYCIADIIRDFEKQRK